MRDGSIVITTINNPTKAIIEYSKICSQINFDLIIVADKKTPLDVYHELPNIKLLTIEEQHDKFGKFSYGLSYNHYCRKNLGYLEALSNSSKIIIDTDDDNLPYPNYLEFIELGLKLDIEADIVGQSDWINVYKYFTKNKIWPRGNPLTQINSSGKYINKIKSNFPVIQGLADLDPDVDAIYRLLNPEVSITFNKNCRVGLDQNSWCSFNSQNTIFNKEYIKYMYLPSFVSFRMTDIWRSFVVQLMLWKKKEKLLFVSPSVYQERNQHDLMKDFEDEIIGYRKNDKISKILNDHLLQNSNLDDLDFYRMTWSILEKESLIEKQELELIDLWIEQTERLSINGN